MKMFSCCNGFSLRRSNVKWKSHFVLLCFLFVSSIFGLIFPFGSFFFLLFFITVSSIIAAVVAKVQGNADTNNNRRTKEHGKKVHNVKENQESFSRKSKIKSWTCILRANRSSNGMHITKSRCFIEIRAERTKREGWVSFLHESKRQSKNWNEHNICSSYSQQ